MTALGEVEDDRIPPLAREVLQPVAIRSAERWPRFRASAR
jgi:hypothetical protein